MARGKICGALDINEVAEASSSNDYSEFYRDAHEAAQNVKLSARSRWFGVLAVILLLIFVLAIYTYAVY